MDIRTLVSFATLVFFAVGPFTQAQTPSLNTVGKTDSNPGQLSLEAFNQHYAGSYQLNPSPNCPLGSNRDKSRNVDTVAIDSVPNDGTPAIRVTLFNKDQRPVATKFYPIKDARISLPQGSKVPQGNFYWERTFEQKGRETKNQERITFSDRALSFDVASFQQETFWVFFDKFKLTENTRCNFTKVGAFGVQKESGRPAPAHRGRERQRRSSF